MVNESLGAHYQDTYSQVDKCRYWAGKAIDEEDLEEASRLISNSESSINAHEGFFTKKGENSMSIDHRRRVDSLWKKVGFIKTRLEKEK